VLVLALVRCLGALAWGLWSLCLALRNPCSCSVCSKQGPTALAQAGLTARRFKELELAGTLSRARVWAWDLASGWLADWPCKAGQTLTLQCTICPTVPGKRTDPGIDLACNSSLCIIQSVQQPADFLMQPNYLCRPFMTSLEEAVSNASDCWMRQCQMPQDIVPTAHNSKAFSVAYLPIQTVYVLYPYD
jgi:hypothetical protein